MAVAKAQPADLIDSLLSGYKNPEDLIGENGLLKQLTKALVERALDAEMEAHLGHAKNDTVTNSSGNTRNGKSSKKLKGEFGELPIEIPRGRNGSFEPQLIPKHQTRWLRRQDSVALCPWHDCIPWYRPSVPVVPALSRPVPSSAGCGC